MYFVVATTSYIIEQNHIIREIIVLFPFLGTTSLADKIRDVASAVGTTDQLNPAVSIVKRVGRRRSY